ncbi:DoxX family protein [Mucilaginibacter ginsenosidivorax]|uniref:DoxX family protein n=1 Tax=Mucilaginibacter ginsenosidivorax TaxID=862126 RepID=A0A5B8VZD4_9SPHI|nr:DoxX family protein [Mucilaginibacter ginsenosidivorax]QEC75896.1 DoxX family protein [Mucilaginibacter ginsenosidivorax]
MNKKTVNITGWILTGLVVFMLAASAIDKIRGSQHALQMTASFGISPDIYQLLGVIEFLSVILFAVPRTGLLGLLLLSAYLGGAIATHLQHHQNIGFPMAIEAIVWITAVIRFPELHKRIMGIT